jgi:hypothetical protein
VFYACLDESGEDFPPSSYFYPAGSEGVGGAVWMLPGGVQADVGSIEESF